MQLPQVSPSSLAIINPDLGQECPRCFWHDRWDKKKHKADQPTACARPRGIFPSLPGGIDRILKTMADRCAPNLPGFLAAAGFTRGTAPLWASLYTYSWFVGFFLAGGLYLLLTWWLGSEES